MIFDDVTRGIKLVKFWIVSYSKNIFLKRYNTVKKFHLSLCYLGKSQQQFQCCSRYHSLKVLNHGRASHNEPLERWHVVHLLYDPVLHFPSSRMWHPCAHVDSLRPSSDIAKCPHIRGQVLDWSFIVFWKSDCWSEKIILRSGLNMAAVLSEEYANA